MFSMIAITKELSIIKLSLTQHPIKKKPNKKPNHKFKFNNYKSGFKQMYKRQNKDN